MEKNRRTDFPEIIYGTVENLQSKRISRLVSRKQIIKLAPRIYTPNFSDTPETIIKRNWFRIIAEQYPGSILSHRSALECKPTPGGHLYLTYSYTKNISLPGLTIHFLKGSSLIQGDHSFFGELYLSQQARAFLENFQVSRRLGEASKTLSRELVEEKLETIIRTKGEAALNGMRDAARQIAPALQMEKEFELLNQTISALLNTQSSKGLSSAVAKWRARGEPFDAARIQLFEQLYETLAGNDYPAYEDKNKTNKAYQNFAFFESYFSNYIEGTLFEVAEAKQIIFTETPMPSRHQDSHDVLGTYRLVSNKKEMAACPKTAEEFIQILLRRHGMLLAARTDKLPGQFKDVNNRAGNTEFVDHQLVNGTLKKGFEWYILLQEPFARAAYMMFLVSEVHPFIDGNGRVARVMMNAELSAKNLSKIMIPLVYRDDYMGALRKLTRQGDAATYIRMMLRVFEFSSGITGEDIVEMEKQLQLCNAFMEPKSGKLQF